MKRILFTLLAVIIVLGLFAATGYAGYRIGYAQGAQRTMDGQMPELRSFDGMGPNRMPMQNWGDQFDRNFGRGFGPGGFPMQGFGFFAPFRFISQLLVLGLFIFFIYWLFTRSGWQLTRKVRTVQTTEAPPPPAETEVKEKNHED